MADIIPAVDARTKKRRATVRYNRVVFDFTRFQRLGLTRNPFGSLSPAEWADIAILPQAVLDALDAGFDHLQVLGGRGRGKTTVLHGLMAHLQEHRPVHGVHLAYEHIPQDQQRFTTSLSHLTWFFLDEAQRLDGWAWRRLLRAAQAGLRLVIASHSDHTARFAHHRLTLTTLRLEETITREHVAAILDRRIAYFRLEAGHTIPYLTPDAVAALVEWYGSDLRGMEGVLYEVFQRLEQPRPIQEADLARLRR